MHIVQELDGRLDLATTQKYMHVSPSAVANAIRVLDENSAIGDSLATAKAALVTA